ncbi:MAG: NUDIX domain-containing protein [Bilophila sp.]
MQTTFPLRSAPEGRALIEFTDEQDRPLLLGPRSEAARLGLRHRVVGVALRDAAGRVYVRKRVASLELYPCCWDLSATGPVHAGESREGAARRLLAAGIGIREAELTQLAAFRPMQSGARLHVTFFVARSRIESPRPNPDLVSEGLFLDKDELDGLACHFPDLLTPALLWVIRTGWLD